MLQSGELTNLSLSFLSSFFLSSFFFLLFFCSCVWNKRKKFSRENKGSCNYLLLNLPLYISKICINHTKKSIYSGWRKKVWLTRVFSVIAKWIEKLPVYLRRHKLHDNSLQPCDAIDFAYTKLTVRRSCTVQKIFFAVIIHRAEAAQAAVHFNRRGILRHSWTG